MGKEIERKFLIKNHEYRKSAEGTEYRQGYVSNAAGCCVRIRTTGGKGYLTIKGRSKGFTRSEYEYEIPLEDAEEMLETLCVKPLIEKTRYKCDYKGFLWEIDEFHGNNEGLTVAEIELAGEDSEFPVPEWIGEEVTYDPRYHNSNLVKYPYKEWINSKGTNNG